MGLVSGDQADISMEGFLATKVQIIRFLIWVILRLFATARHDIQQLTISDPVQLAEISQDQLIYSCIIIPLLLFL